MATMGQEARETASSLPNAAIGYCTPPCVFSGGPTSSAA